MISTRTLVIGTIIWCIIGWPVADDTLGKLSEKYESGGRGPGTVSTGKGDPGGVSYGTYQLASKIGRADAFVKKYYPREFEGLKGGTPEFTAKWKELAVKDPKALHANEHAYIKDTHYDPQVKKLEKDLKVDVTKRSAAFRDVVWSVAVHHGPNTDVIVVAVKPLLEKKKLDELSDEEIIRAIYAERGRKNADGKLVRFKGVSDDWIPALTRRFENEMKDALEMLKKGEKPEEVRKKFYGCWLELDRVDAGVAIKDPVHLVGLKFAENGYWLWGRRGELSTGVGSEDYRVRIDATANPMRVDIIAPKRQTPPGKGEMVQVGIFKFEGDKMILALAPWAWLDPPEKGKDYAIRPKSFESTKENKVMLSTYKPTEFYGVD